MLETIQLAHIPVELPIYAAIYRDVENTTFLKEQLLAGNSDFEYAFIDASMVLSRKQLLAATFRAMNDYMNDRLKSKNVHSEIVFALSPNNNIVDAFRRFGISETTKDLLVLKIATNSTVTSEQVQQHLSDSVKGTQVSFNDEELQNISDIPRIRKVYKISPGDTKSSSKQLTNGSTAHEIDERVELERQVLGLMALRGAT